MQESKELRLYSIDNFDATAYVLSGGNKGCVYRHNNLLFITIPDMLKYRRSKKSIVHDQETCEPLNAQQSSPADKKAGGKKLKLGYSDSFGFTVWVSSDEYDTTGCCFEYDDGIFPSFGDVLKYRQKYQSENGGISSDVNGKLIVLTDLTDG